MLNHRPYCRLVRRDGVFGSVAKPLPFERHPSGRKALLVSLRMREEDQLFVHLFLLLAPVAMKTGSPKNRHSPHLRPQRGKKEKEERSSSQREGEEDMNFGEFYSQKREDFPFNTDQR
jgi:hypothetical protein